MTVFSGLWPRIKHLFADAEAAAVSFADSLISGIASLTPQGLVVIADAVKSAETVGGSSNQKFGAAVATATAELTKIGVTAAPYLLNGAIEAAVATLKKQQADNAALAATKAVPEKSATPAAPSAAPDAGR